MKKILLGLLVFVSLFLITGCGKDETENKNDNKKEELGVAVVINNDGQKENKTYKELYDVLKENNEYYTNHYDGSKVTIVDTVKKIQKDSLVSWPKTPGGSYFIGHTYELELSSGWLVYIDQNNNDLSDILSGTKVEVTSYLHDNTFWPIVRGDFENDSSNKSIETTDSTIKVIE